LDSVILIFLINLIQQGENPTLRPVTIKQILDATQAHPEAPFQIDGADIGSVYCVGQVRNISTQSTNITYKLDDGTGEIEAKQWVDSTTARLEDDMDVDGQGVKHSTRKKVELNGFVKVYGKLKVFGNKRFLGAHNVRPVSNVSEISVHFLEATAVHLFFKQGPPQSKAGGAGASAKGATDDATDDGGRALPPMSASARRVYNLLKSEPQTNEGLHMQNISAKLGLPSTDVIKAGDELLSAGLIFPTMDEYTWAILEY
jgi:replication factor A2